MTKLTEVEKVAILFWRNMTGFSIAEIAGKILGSRYLTEYDEIRKEVKSKWLNYQSMNE